MVSESGGREGGGSNIRAAVWRQILRGTLWWENVLFS